MSGWTVRRIVPEDQKAIERIAHAGLDTYADFTPGWTRPKRFDEANERRMAELLVHPSFIGHLAEAAGEPVGYVALWQSHTWDDSPAPIPGLAHLGQLFVLPDWWGTGMAKELLDAAVDGAREAGFERVRLFTPSGQARARRFYEREGWRPTGEERFNDTLGLEIVEYAVAL